MSDGPVPELERVRRAAKALRRAQGAYRAAVLEAHDAGNEPAAIGHAAGIKRQSARGLVGRLLASRPCPCGAVGDEEPCRRPVGRPCARDQRRRP